MKNKNLKKHREYRLQQMGRILLLNNRFLARKMLAGLRRLIGD
jgi:hypothetical protein